MKLVKTTGGASEGAGVIEAILSWWNTFRTDSNEDTSANLFKKSASLTDEDRLTFVESMQRVGVSGHQAVRDAGRMQLAKSQASAFRELDHVGGYGPLHGGEGKAMRPLMRGMSGGAVACLLPTMLQCAVMDRSFQDWRMVNVGGSGVQLHDMRGLTDMDSDLLSTSAAPCSMPRRSDLL